MADRKVQPIYHHQDGSRERCASGFADFRSIGIAKAQILKKRCRLLLQELGTRSLYVLYLHVGSCSSFGNTKILNVDIIPEAVLFLFKKKEMAQ